MGIAIEEQETSVNWCRDEKIATIYASDSTTITKLDKYVRQPDSEWKLISVSNDKSGNIVGKTYSCPKQLISFRSKRIERNLSDEQRAIISERLKRVRERNKNNLIS